MNTTKKITRKVTSKKKVVVRNKKVSSKTSLLFSAMAVYNNSSEKAKSDIERDTKFLNKYETVYEYITNQVKAPRKTLTNNVEFKKFYHQALAKCPLLTCDKDRLCATKKVVKATGKSVETGELYEYDLVTYKYEHFDGWYSIFYSIYVRDMKPKGF